MLHILLLILKIIGILLAVVLGIVVLLICIILFAPIRYEGRANAENSVESIKVNVKFSWVLHFISGYVNYEESRVHWQVRIFWKKLNVPKKELEASQEQTEVDEETHEEIEEKTSKKPAKAPNKRNEKKQKETGIRKKKDKDEQEKGGKKKNGENNKKESFFERIKYTIQTFYDKIKATKEKVGEIEAFIKDETHQSALKCIKQEVVRFLRSLKPKRLEANVCFGFENPATTGQVLAALSVLYPFYASSINIEPDFENQTLDGDVFIKGKIQLVSIVVMVWNIVIDKNVRMTYKDFKNVKDNM